MNILITGANRGIGLALTQYFLQAGHKVLATCRSQNAATDLMTLNQQHDDLIVTELDVADNQQIDALAINFPFQSLDMLINNAGLYGEKQSLEEVAEAEWLKVLQVNTMAPFFMTRAMLPFLRKGTGKRVCHITSKMGSITDNNSGGAYIYRSSKTALNMVNRSLSVDLAVDNIVTSVFHPGWVQTDMGGPNALIDAATSVRGLAEKMLSLSDKDTGQFFEYTGKVLPW